MLTIRLRRNRLTRRQALEGGEFPWRIPTVPGEHSLHLRTAEHRQSFGRGLIWAACQ